MLSYWFHGKITLILTTEIISKRNIELPTLQILGEFVYGSSAITCFRLLIDFVCIYTYEFWLSLCKIVRSSVILLSPLWSVYAVKKLETNYQAQFQNGSQVDNTVDVLHRYMLNFKFYHVTDILLTKTICPYYC
jgi:hypothetical protein